MASSGIRDNHSYGKVGDFLSEKIKPDGTLSIVSAYFSIYGFDALRNAHEITSTTSSLSLRERVGVRGYKMLKLFRARS